MFKVKTKNILAILAAGLVLTLSSLAIKHETLSYSGIGFGFGSYPGHGYVYRGWPISYISQPENQTCGSFGVDTCDSLKNTFGAIKIKPLSLAENFVLWVIIFTALFLVIKKLRRNA